MKIKYCKKYDREVDNILEPTLCEGFQKKDNRYPRKMCFYCEHYERREEQNLLTIFLIKLKRLRAWVVELADTQG